MWSMDISGKKKAVLLAWANALGYEEPEIDYESRTDDEYTRSCSVSTRYEANPYGDKDTEWDGTKVDLSRFEESDIREGRYYLFLNVVGLKQSIRGRIVLGC